MKSFLTIIFSITITALSAQKIDSWKITDYQQFVRENTIKNKIVVANFWATFCKPCLAELPGFIQTVKSFGGDSIQLVLVSLDSKEMYPARLQQFVKTKKYDARVTWLNETNADYFCPAVSEKWSGSIPATIIINGRTDKVEFFEEELSANELKAAIIRTGSSQ